GAGGSPHVIIYAGMSSQILQSFLAFDQAFAGGVNVAAGNFNISTTANQPNLQPAVFAAAGAGGKPVVSVFNASNDQQVASFFAFDQQDSTGVNIGSEVASNGNTLLYLGTGRDQEPTVRVVDGNTFSDQQN